MAIQRRTRNLIAYGLDNSLQTLAPSPIVSQRAPTVSDSSPIGTLWIDQPTNLIYCLSSISNAQAMWQLLEASGGAGVFTSLTVNPGPVNMLTDTATAIGNFGTGAGDKTITIGSVTGGSTTTIYGGDVNFSITLETDSGTDETIVLRNNQGTSNDAIGLFAYAGGVIMSSTTQAALSAPLIYVDDTDLVPAPTTILIGTRTGVAHTVTVGGTDTTSSTTIQAGTGGIALNAAGIVSMAPVTGTVASPTATQTINANVIVATFTGFSTVGTGVQAFTIVSSKILATSGIFVSVTCATTGAEMTISGVQQLVGSIVVNTQNTGASTVADNIIVSVWIIS